MGRTQDCFEPSWSGLARSAALLFFVPDSRHARVTGYAKGLFAVGRRRPELRSAGQGVLLKTSAGLRRRWLPPRSRALTRLPAITQCHRNVQIIRLSARPKILTWSVHASINLRASIFCGRFLVREPSLGKRSSANSILRLCVRCGGEVGFLARPLTGRGPPMTI